jgi:hypothetical protein
MLISVIRQMIKTMKHYGYRPHIIETLRAYYLMSPTEFHQYSEFVHALRKRGFTWELGRKEKTSTKEKGEAKQ